MIIVKERSKPQPAQLGRQEMGSMVNGVISVLVIANGRSGGDASPAALVDMQAGADDPGRHRLRWIHVQGLEEAAAHLRDRRVDAILLDERDAGGIGWLQAYAADLPILVMAEDTRGETARRAVVAGAQDVLPTSSLAGDNAGDGLAQRLDLAIARKGFERQRLRQAHRDPLTGLARGTLIEERFARAMARADRFATLVGLVAIDLDGFDDLIARHGQIAADRLLSLAGQRFLGETRETDTLARTRDHGFTWLVEGLSAIDDINALVNRLPAQLARPFSIDDADLRLTASVGVAICPFHGRDFPTLLAMAEAAMLDVATVSGDALLTAPVSPAEPRALT